MEDAQIIDHFFRRDPEAIRAAQEKYEKRCLAAARHILFHTKIGVKLCSMAGGGVSRNLWNFFRTAPAGTGQAVTCSTSGMGLRLK